MQALLQICAVLICSQVDDLDAIAGIKILHLPTQRVQVAPYRVR